MRTKIIQPTRVENILFRLKSKYLRPSGWQHFSWLFTSKLFATLRVRIIIRHSTANQSESEIRPVQSASLPAMHDLYVACACTSWSNEFIKTAHFFPQSFFKSLHVIPSDYHLFKRCKQSVNNLFPFHCNCSIFIAIIILIHWWDPLNSILLDHSADFACDRLLLRILKKKLSEHSHYIPLISE